MSGVSYGYDRVPVTPLQEAFLASGLSLCEVCRRLGWPNPRQRTTNLRRMLGLAPQWNGNTGTRAYTVWSTRIGYDHAVALARALDVDPVDLGL